MYFIKDGRQHSMISATYYEESYSSVKGILRSEILRVKANFAAMSAFSLPLIPA